MGSMQIHLIRHGKTAANEQGLYCGQADPSLSANGTAAIVSLQAEGLYPAAVEAYFTSGLRRTEETLALIYGNVGRTAMPGLREYDFGQFEMQSHEALKGLAAYQAWIHDETGHVSCPGGESRHAYARRVREAFDLLVDEVVCQGHRNVVAVVHGGVIAHVMARLFPHVRDFYGWQPDHGHGYSLTYEQGQCMGFVELSAI